VTEGASTNAWIVTKDGCLKTRPLSKAILPGVVRGIMVDTAQKLGLSIEEGAFTVKDAKIVKEEFFYSMG